MEENTTKKPGKLNPVAHCAAVLLVPDSATRAEMIDAIQCKETQELCTGQFPGGEQFTVEFLQKYPILVLMGFACVVYLPFLVGGLLS